MRNSLMTFLI